MVKRECLGVSTVYHNGATHIPVAVRKALQIKDGDRIVWVAENGRFLVEPAEQEVPLRYTVLR